MRTPIFALASVAALTTAAPAHAAFLDYVVSGTMTDGTTFTGAFTIDDTKSGFKQYSNYSITVAGKSFNTIYGLGTNLKSYFYIYSTGGSGQFTLGINGKADQDQKILSLNLGSLSTDTTRYTPAGSPSTSLASGTIALANTAVPEASTWMMMILGFGAIGYAMRRKRVIRYV